MKKIVLLSIAVLIAISAYGLYAMTRQNIEELIVCASDEKASYIPSVICETYLFDFRGHPSDISFLKNRTGINFLANIENPQKRQRMFEFFIDRGMDVNAISNVDGLSPLHAAVLLNDPELVRFLLKKGANTLVRERTNGLTPLEFVVQMDAQLPGVDRSRVKQALQSQPR